MYELYYYPGMANLAPHMMLEDIGAEHRLIRVDRDKGEHKSPEYLKLNPKGLIPVLVDGDLVLYETAAICLHLADRHPQANLAPALGTHGRAHMYKWLMHMTNTVQSDVLVYNYPDRYTTDPGGVEAVKAASAARLENAYQQIDAHLAEGPYLLGDTFSLADYYLLLMARWGRNMANPPRTLPNLGRSLDRIAERPAVARAFAAEGMEKPYY
ncbi:MAG: glutathione S-transferase family protein [Rhodospirillaceae bacterium]|nr:glutathione S-transferase family protein [Rhodospirillaceae bacterium]